ncbi:hypothetical protein ACOSQ3_004346 [Xanthoceras sorbifolium]
MPLAQYMRLDGHLGLRRRTNVSDSEDHDQHQEIDIQTDRNRQLQLMVRQPLPFNIARCLKKVSLAGNIVDQVFKNPMSLLTEKVLKLSLCVPINIWGSGDRNVDLLINTGLEENETIKDSRARFRDVSQRICPPAPAAGQTTYNLNLGTGSGVTEVCLTFSFFLNNAD